MASFGRRSVFAFPLGGDSQAPWAGTPGVFGSIAGGPTGIRFANLPLSLRGVHGISQSELTKYSAPVTMTSAAPADKPFYSGVIIGKPGSIYIYGKTPSTVLGTERRNLDAFGNVIFED
jgi:hypothetical protein